MFIIMFVVFCVHRGFCGCGITPQLCGIVPLHLCGASLFALKKMIAWSQQMFAKLASIRSDDIGVASSSDVSLMVSVVCSKFDAGLLVLRWLIFIMAVA